MICLQTLRFPLLNDLELTQDRRDCIREVKLLFERVSKCLYDQKESNPILVAGVEITMRLNLVL
jgi:hypothetical protein